MRQRRWGERRLELAEADVPEACNKIAWYGQMGLSRPEIAAVMGWRVQELDRLERLMPEIREALETAAEAEQAWWLAAGRQGIAAKNFNAELWAAEFQRRFGLVGAKPAEVDRNAEQLRVAVEKRLQRLADHREAPKPKGDEP